MPLKGFRVQPTNAAEWDRFFRDVPVVPDPNSVGADELKADAVGTANIRNANVTNQKLADMPGTSLKGRTGSTSGTPTDFTANVDGQFLVRRAATLTFDALADSDIPASIARDSEVTAAVAAHIAASDPHPQYETQTEADARYRQLSVNVPYGEISGKPAVFSLLFGGAGSPETVVTAPIGSLFLRTDGGAGTTLYVKESGSGNTGWVGK